ncbi:MAG: Rrf2 family transcriptional regulator [Betaproteobacteria bacterium]|nr:Rrf2 family transcriptional regulator [Betaproteobacteria bacterium]MDE2359487.1 Rrf2 family transcriptional regulator [Betaproteobacteria bacterium]
MRLTTFSDYSLRVLMYLGVQGERLATIGEVARAYGVSENHLVKVVHHLAQHGYVETTRGKGGGMRLARPPETINVGEVVRGTEGKLTLVECFDRATSDCRIEPACVLKGMLSRAVDAFFAALEGYTLADLLVTKPRLTRLLVVSDVRPPRGRTRTGVSRQP